MRRVRVFGRIAWFALTKLFIVMGRPFAAPDNSLRR
jgi:hypothetical protein